MRAGARPFPESSSSEAVPTELSQGELSTSLPDTQAQVPPGPTDAPGQRGVWTESRPPPTCQPGAPVSSVHPPCHPSASFSGTQGQIPTEPSEIPKQRTTSADIRHRRSLLDLPMPPGTKSGNSPRVPAHEEHRLIESIVTNRGHRLII